MPSSQSKRPARSSSPAAAYHTQLADPMPSGANSPSPVAPPKRHITSSDGSSDASSISSGSRADRDRPFNDLDSLAGRPPPPRTAGAPESTTSHSLLENGLWHLMAPVFTELDTGMEDVQHSQVELSQTLERILAELQLLDQATEPPPRLKGCIQNLTDARRKLTNINYILRGVQERLDRLNEKAVRL
ncbi:hypothetical protein H4R33_001114 [Dimargaris cristalligena]|uniref:Biogenesis of lysosome-related organelles complex 1 subunit 7 n=1 Tax=Dimargaris cristalligena TaxID=215637 RepID=A0A4Q0A258_9FUNG|nr:hypothetical protein H4R33_001114 [Dimargaris cristalligena]RKP40185.1 hypothetical protein BJ085DRAFT_35280 [Dimargaris cristalligena]|eukprot:RKP40185.1 hypothetical protein BJ085DRAFT_35280 [Dimargaris cristalligena]